ncbi:hypothetical protein QJS10_CPA16g01520 [Acorus calamus]|uniref:Uncharacterized protein n=1 Tax=Acorus calamus TaxID=4465 RepID=A0AAV9CYQ8_ACOCL|nr:hypothetical protein QJS10_CPA16g01520 [Acorus calamus]
MEDAWLNPAGGRRGKNKESSPLDYVFVSYVHRFSRPVQITNRITFRSILSIVIITSASWLIFVKNPEVGSTSAYPDFDVGGAEHRKIKFKDGSSCLKRLLRKVLCYVHQLTSMLVCCNVYGREGKMGKSVLPKKVRDALTHILQKKENEHLRK